MKQRYIVKRGPVQPPFSLYGQRAPLQTGERLESEANPWIRGCVRDERLALDTQKKGKRKAQTDGGQNA